MSNPLASVVIPTFNKSQTIGATVESVLRQTYPNVEIILVDNGSTDSTKEVISKLETSISNLRVIYLPANLGPSNARNTGIRNASGRYIFLLDGDDLFHPGKIATQVEFMKVNPEFAISVTYYLTSDSAGRGLRLIKFRSINSLLVGWIRMTGFGGLVESTGCIDATRIQDSLLFDTSLMGSEGLDFLMKWKLSFPVGMIRSPLTLYLLSDKQLHLDATAIRENVGRLNPKYIKNSLGIFYAKRLQASFFRINDIRHKSFGSIVVEVLFSLNVFQLIMIFSIIKRNLIARASGLRYKSRVNSFFGSDG